MSPQSKRETAALSGSIFFFLEVEIPLCRRRLLVDAVSLGFSVIVLAHTQFAHTHSQKSGFVLKRPFVCVVESVQCSCVAQRKSYDPLMTECHVTERGLD